MSDDKKPENHDQPDKNEKKDPVENESKKTLGEHIDKILPPETVNNIVAKTKSLFSSVMGSVKNLTKTKKSDDVKPENDTKAEAKKEEDKAEKKDDKKDNAA